MRVTFILALLLAALNAIAAPKLIASFPDPAGDDFGDGSLVYPSNFDYQEGDLDLRNISISRDSEGFWFEAIFANPIRSPASAHAGAGASSIADYARKGFYNFNIDIYIDADRTNDSGNTFSLPGRRVRMDPKFAWEKAVVLTPRPEQMRSELLDALQRQYPQRSESEASMSIEQAIYFPTRVKVRGKAVAFFVPQDFFGIENANDWAMTVLVTAAKPYVSVGAGLLSSKKLPLEELELGVLQPSSGRPQGTFGYSGSGVPSSVVDMLLPTREQQIGQLRGGTLLSGVSWGHHAEKDRMVTDETVLSSESTQAVNKKNDEKEQDGPIGFFRRKLGTQSSSQRDLPSQAVPIKTLIEPSGEPIADRPMERRHDGTVVSSKPSIEVRLKALQKLFEQKLIDETEFRAQKQRILSDL